MDVTGEFVTWMVASYHFLLGVGLPEGACGVIVSVDGGGVMPELL